MLTLLSGAKAWYERVGLSRRYLWNSSIGVNFRRRQRRSRVQVSNDSRHVIVDPLLRCCRRGLRVTHVILLVQHDMDGFAADKQERRREPQPCTPCFQECLLAMHLFEPHPEQHARSICYFRKSPTLPFCFAEWETDTGMTRARKKATNDKKALRETCASMSNSDCSDSRVVV